jgi:hypothetical protein
MIRRGYSGASPLSNCKHELQLELMTQLLRHCPLSLWTGSVQETTTQPEISWLVNLAYSPRVIYSSSFGQLVWLVFFKITATYQ